MTQCETLIEAFKRGEKLTVLEALQRYGVYALSQRVGNIKRDHGISVQMKMIDTGTGKRVAQYSL